MVQSLFLFWLMLFPSMIQTQSDFSSLNHYSSSGDNRYLNENPNQSKYSQPIVQSNFQPTESSSTSSSSSIISNFNNRYLVGNISQSFSFQVAPSSVKVSYLGLNGFSLYIMGVGFSNKSKFNYDEQNNRLTILSLDATTVGHYSAVDNNWKTFTTILTAIDVSSLVIENFRVQEENSLVPLVSCSVSIIRSTFKEIETNPSTPSISSSTTTGIENLARLTLSISSRSFPSLSMSDEKLYNDTFLGQKLIRSITMKQALTRADHNATLQCQVESNNNIDVYLTKTESVDILYGPDLEAGATQTVTLTSEMLKIMSMECQIEGNPSPSYVWYEMMTNTTKDLSVKSDLNSMFSPTSSQSVFGTTRQIQRIYQHPGSYSMQCQAQSNGKTVRQDFFITVQAQSLVKTPSDLNQFDKKTNNLGLIVGIIVGAILLALVVALVVGSVIYLKRRKSDPPRKDSIVDKTLSDKTCKSRWGNTPIDYGKYKTDSSSTSHLVESAENGSIQVVSTGSRSSPVNSQHSSYRQTPSTLVSLSYRQASALPGFRPLTSNNSCSVEHDEVDEVSTSIVIRPSTINRSRTTTPLGSHRSLSASIQSLRSNQQPTVILPMKKRSNDSTNQTKREDFHLPENDYKHHLYQNPSHLQNQFRSHKIEQNSSEDDDQQQIRSLSSNYGDPSKNSYSTQYNQIKTENVVNENHYAASVVPDRSTPLVNNLKEKTNDEVPPSYQQASNNLSNLNSYIYREPTEV